MRSSLVSFLKTFRRGRVRAARGSRRRSAVTSVTTGRTIRTVRYAPGKNRLAPLQTILRAAANTGYDRTSGRLRITRRDMRGWHRTEFESLTLILLVDVSKSTWPFVEVFKEILQSLTAYFNRHNDRVGLISLQGMQAKIYNHPTHNLRVVARGLGQLKFHGETPLADGLAKSMAMARLEKSKNPGSRSIVILLSDCYPEPLTRGRESLFDDPAYRNAINTAATYRRSKLTLLLINPSFQTPEATLPGEVLSDRIVQASGGKLIKLIRPPDRRHLPPSTSEMDRILRGIETSMKQ